MGDESKEVQRFETILFDSCWNEGRTLRKVEMLIEYLGLKYEETRPPGSTSITATLTEKNNRGEDGKGSMTNG